MHTMQEMLETLFLMRGSKLVFSELMHEKRLMHRGQWE